MSALNGSWALVSSENYEAYINAIGVSSENRDKALKEHQTTGSGGVVEKYEVDLTANTFKRTILVDGKPVRESPAVQLNTEVEGKKFDDRVVKVKMTIEGTNRLIRTETGPGFSVINIGEVDGDHLTHTMTTGDGVKAVRKYKRV